VIEKQDLTKCNNETISILVADDDPEILSGTVRLLRSVGYTVFEATTGDACLKTAHELAPDLVLLDVELPDIIGYEVCRQIKMDQTLNCPHVVMISGRMISSDNRSQGLEIGADGYILRPLSNRELLAGVQAFCRIIRTERELKQMKKRIELLNKERYQSILKTAMDGFWLTDIKEGQLLQVNDSYCRISGYSEDELLAMKISDLEANESPQETHAHMLKVVEKGSDRFESIHRRKDGTLFDVEISLQFRNEEGGQCVCFLRDISERKKAEADLVKYSQRLQLATTSGKLAIWDWDVVNNIMFWDDRMFELYGISRDTFPNNLDAWTNGLHPDDKQRSIDECNSALLGEKEFNTTFRVIHPNGTIKHLRASGLVIRDNSGKAVRMIGINRDITEQKKAEEERKNLEAHLQQAQKMEAIGTLAGGIAHDFNNILGAILGFSEMAKEDSLSGKINPRDLDQIIQAGTRAKALVNQILTFSRQTETQRIPLRPSVIVSESIRLLRSSIPTTIIIQQDVDPKTDLTLADPTQIYQIIMNLCTNAYHAMEDTGGTLTISLKNIILTKQDLINVPDSRPGNFVRLSVKDTGVGIEPEIRNKIFDPYFTTKETGKGTGMGLAIAHGIIKSYGGFITCRSERGVETVFEVSLPALSEQVAPETEEFKLIPEGSERILFIDDEPVLVEMSKNMLSRLGYSVTVRTNSLEALTTFQNQPEAFDLVITDQTMPGITGFDLARRMLQIRPNIPIILCTGYSSLVTEEKAKAFGIKGFSLKPLVKKEIAGLIRKVLDGCKREEFV